jgi:hypothetical protein
MKENIKAKKNLAELKSIAKNLTKIFEDLRGYL